jgi:predicted 3-demethylubiquinone-9 3-methyltransferase (glyoxalase superfamily)
MALKRITPFLWYDSQAEEAANLYVAVFPNSKVTKTVRYGAGGPGPPGSVWVVEFELDGQPIMALNGGPHYKLSEGFSFLVNCETQEEIDHYWSKLNADAAGGQCGWLKDRFGLTWQIVPSELPGMLSDPDPGKAQRVFKTMLTMKKLDIRKLQDAHDNS